MLIQSSENFGNRPSVEFCGDVFRRIYPVMTQSVRMAFEGRSVATGALPEWLRRASDVRVLGFVEQGGDTLVQLEAPSFGDAVEELYCQRQSWDELPNQNATAIHVMARVVNDVRFGNAESGLYDLGLLRVTLRLDSLFHHNLEAIRLPMTPLDSDFSAVLDREVPIHARQLSISTPSPRQVRLTGTLDMIRYSTRAFALKLKDGREVHGSLDRTDMVESLTKYLNKQVLIVGKAVYRPSGSVLRIDAQHIEEDTGESSLFNRIPPPLAQRPVAAKFRVSSTSRNGIPAFFGTWPGQETDEDLLTSLKELRG